MRLAKIGNGKDIVIMASHDIDSAKEIYDLVGIEFTMYALIYDDWDSDFSPWERGEFRGSGQRTMDFLKDFIDNTKFDGRLFYAGYSLAGLFGLWAHELFDGIASCSGSLWYPGFTEYFATQIISDKPIYLSIGGKEGRDIVEIHKTLHKKIPGSKLEMNAGGHFSKVSLRIAKGIRWLLAH